MRSYASTSSTDVTVAFSSQSDTPCNTCDTYSHPARVSNTHWNGVVASFAFSANRWVRVRVPNCLKKSPTTIPLVPFFFKFLQHGHTSESQRTDNHRRDICLGETARQFCQQLHVGFVLWETFSSAAVTPERFPAAIERF